MHMFTPTVVISCLVLLGSCTAMNMAQPFAHPTHPTHPSAVPPTATDPYSSCSQGYCYYFGISGMTKLGTNSLKWCNSEFYGYYNEPNATMSSTFDCGESGSWDATVSFENTDTDDWSATVIVEGLGSLVLTKPDVYTNSYVEVAGGNLFLTASVTNYSEQPQYCAKVCSQ